MKAAQWMGSKSIQIGEYILSVEPHGLDRSIEASGFRSTDSVTHKVLRATGLEGDSADTVS